MKNYEPLVETRIIKNAQVQIKWEQFEVGLNNNLLELKCILVGFQPDEEKEQQELKKKINEFAKIFEESTGLPVEIVLSQNEEYDKIVIPIERDEIFSVDRKLLAKRVEEFEKDFDLEDFNIEDHQELLEDLDDYVQDAVKTTEFFQEILGEASTLFSNIQELYEKKNKNSRKK